MTEASLFGSFVRSEMRPYSDLDLALICPKSKSPRLSELIDQLSEATTATFGNPVSPLIGTGSIQAMAQPGSSRYGLWRTVAKGLRIISAGEPIAQGKRVRVDRAQARVHLQKAQEFLNSARASLEAGKADAAELEAIHSAIRAAEAVTAALAGVRSSGPDHSRAVDLLKEVGPSGEVASRARQLEQLLSKKNLVECEARRTRASEAAEAVKRAKRLTAWAETVVEPAKLDR